MMLGCDLMDELAPFTLFRAPTVLHDAGDRAGLVVLNFLYGTNGL